MERGPHSDPELKYSALYVTGCLCLISVPEVLDHTCPPNSLEVPSTYHCQSQFSFVNNPPSSTRSEIPSLSSSLSTIKSVTSQEELFGIHSEIMKSGIPSESVSK